MLTEAFPGECDVCPVCEQVFRRAEGCPCSACNRNHWHEEWCVERENETLHDDDGRLNWFFDPSDPRRPSLRDARLASLVREALEHRIALDVLIGVRMTPREGRISFWLRAPRSRLWLVDPGTFYARVVERLPVTLVVEMIEPPAWS